MEIIPAIIGKDFDEVEEKFDQVENLVRWVQFDIMDGLFTENESWPYFDFKEEPENLEYLDFVRTDTVKAELHLMVKHPEKHLSKWIEAGVDRVLVHYEATSEEVLNDIIEELEQAEVQVGIALKLETSIDVLDNFIDKLDVVQLMGIAEIGSYGIQFNEKVYDKIKGLRARYPGATIEVDGGVSLENAKKLIEVGVDNLVIGSAIFKSENIPETILKFRSII
ncbi:MAG: hypothetical protein HY225_02650 [Candidatus Vogelbacteria bacterium]|nr:hypothetical protein [Candidatus Vogelbacteria bacterium]